MDTRQAMIDKTNAYLSLRRLACLLGMVVLTVAVAACRSKEPKVRHYPYRHVEPALLASAPLRAKTNAYAIVQKGKTVGRFPCSIAVMRVTSELPGDFDEGDEPAQQRLKIDLLPEIKAVPWTELFDNFPAITAVKVMGRPSVIFQNVTVPALIKAGRRQNAALALIYGQTDLKDGLVRIVGAMYDTKTNELVATVGAQVTPEYGSPAPPDRLEQDRRHEDPECLTAAKFQDLVLCCIDELARMDTPAATTQPNPWHRPGVRPMSSPWTGPREIIIR